MTCHRVHDPVLAKATILRNRSPTSRIGDCLSRVGSIPSEKKETRSVQAEPERLLAARSSPSLRYCSPLARALIDISCQLPCIVLVVLSQGAADASSSSADRTRSIGNGRFRPSQRSVPSGSSRVSKHTSRRLPSGSEKYTPHEMR
jgi:hypothetical protein